MDVKTLSEMEPWEWPEGAAGTLSRALTDRRVPAAERVLAAEMAGELVVLNDELAETLMSIINSDEETDELRGRAAISLGPVLEQADMEIDDVEELPISEGTLDKILEVLESVLADGSMPKEVRRRALEASVRYGQPWHAEAVRAAYNDPDPDWKLTAVFSMRYVRGFKAEILESLNSTDQEVKAEAIQAAGAEALEEAWPQIARLVRDKRTPKDLLIPAIEAIACIRPDEAIDLLIPLTQSRDEDIAEAAEEAIGMAEMQAATLDDDEDDGKVNWVN